MAELTETDRIERDLARTRARMDGRLDELQDHLRPKQIINDAFAYFRGGDGADFTHDLVVHVKANPLPVALAGIGIAWMMASGGRATSAAASEATTSHDDFEARLWYAEGGVERFEDDDEDSYARRLDDARGAVVGVARTNSETGASYGQRIKDAVASARQKAREMTHDVSTGAGNALGRFEQAARERGTALKEGAPDMARSARDTFSAVTGNPFALGAIAAVVGIVAGSLIPTLDEEESALGSVATKVRTAGRDLAQDVVDRGGRIANETLDAVKSSAEAHGLTSDKPVGELVGDLKSGDLAENIKQVAQETVQAGKDSAQTHFAGHDVPPSGQSGS
jgi:ElaB/YqjD/DUF883 family membrane-anchored ribosome-binding protein